MTVPQGRGETILVVDGNPVLRGLVWEMLAYIGYTVLGAKDGPAALHTLETSGHVDLLFTTLMLPLPMTGPELARRARARLPGLRVLYASDDSETAVRQMQSLGKDAVVITRPWPKGELALKVRAGLEAPED